MASLLDGSKVKGWIAAVAKWPAVLFWPAFLVLCVIGFVVCLVNGTLRDDWRDFWAKFHEV